MRIPVEFRLLMLLILAWRLIVAGKKKFDFGHRNYEDLFQKPENKPIKPEIKSSYLFSYQEYYRKVVRGHENENKVYFIIFLAQKLEKHFRKGGIFRLFWYDQPLVISFYQALIYLDLKSESEIFEKILTKISIDGFNILKSNQIENLKPDTFSVHGDDHFKEFDEFENIFSLENFLKALHNKI